jgi:succinyl-diaminopimelate desuccinylase
MKLPSADTFGFETCATLLAQLVEVDTCQPVGSEAALVDIITQRYPNSPVEITRLEHSLGRASLVIKLPGKTDSGSLALVGHLDTVPVGDPAAWETPPLTATIKDGVLYGRGAADMKGGVAAMLLALDELLQNWSWIFARYLEFRIKRLRKN